jgi:hypothetical protein
MTTEEKKQSWLNKFGLGVDKETHTITIKKDLGYKDIYTYLLKVWDSNYLRNEGNPFSAASASNNKYRFVIDAPWKIIIDTEHDQRTLTSESGSLYQRRR